MIEPAQQAEGAAGPSDAATKSLYPPRSYQQDLVDLAVNNNVGAARHQQMGACPGHPCMCDDVDQSNALYGATDVLYDAPYVSTAAL